jgi:hypothetical protein
MEIRFHSLSILRAIVVSKLARTGARTGTLGGAHTAGCSFGENRNACVEVDTPPLAALGVVSPNPSIDGVAGDAQERKGLWLWSPCTAFLAAADLEGSVIAGLTNHQDKEKVVQSRWRRG